MTNFWAFVNVCSYHNKTVRDRILKKNILGYNVMFQYFHKYCFTLVLSLGFMYRSPVLLAVYLFEFDEKNENSIDQSQKA